MHTVYMLVFNILILIMCFLATEMLQNNYINIFSNNSKMSIYLKNILLL